MNDFVQAAHYLSELIAGETPVLVKEVLVTNLDVVIENVFLEITDEQEVYIVLRRATLENIIEQAGLYKEPDPNGGILPSAYGIPIVEDDVKLLNLLSKKIKTHPFPIEFSEDDER